MAQHPRRARFGLWYTGSSTGLKAYALVHVFAFPIAAITVFGGVMLRASTLLITGICVGGVAVIDGVVVYPVLNARSARARADARNGTGSAPDPRSS